MKRVDSHSPFNSAHRAASQLSVADAVAIAPIAKSLASLYDGMLDEPLPEQLAVLLRRVDETLRQRG